jgi:hypothetical protein
VKVDAVKPAAVGRLTLALAAATALAVASTASAGLGSGLGSGLLGAALPSCGAVSYPFAQFGDRGAYCSPANNGFESGAAGWTLSGGASVVADNEPWHVSGPGRNALDLPPGARAISSPVPISLLDPHLRLFARSSAADGALRVQVLFQGLTGNLTGILNVSDLSPSDYTSWEPSSDVASLLALPLGTTSAQVLVTSLASAGDWRIDDVFVDPWLNRLG